MADRVEKEVLVTLSLQQDNAVDLSKQQKRDLFTKRQILLTPNNNINVTIGRSSKGSNKNLAPAANNAWFENVIMSRKHALLSADFEREIVTLCDLDSLHGTYLIRPNGSGRIPKEGEKVPKHDIELKKGDSLTFGGVVWRNESIYKPTKVRVDWTFKYLQRPAPTFTVPDADSEQDISEAECDIIDLTKEEPAKLSAVPQFAKVIDLSMGNDDVQAEATSIMKNVPARENPTPPSPQPAIDHALKSDVQALVPSNENAPVIQQGSESRFPQALFHYHRISEDLDDMEDQNYVKWNDDIYPGPVSPTVAPCSPNLRIDAVEEDDGDERAQPENYKVEPAFENENTCSDILTNSEAASEHDTASEDEAPVESELEEGRWKLDSDDAGSDDDSSYGYSPSPGSRDFVGGELDKPLDYVEDAAQTVAVAVKDNEDQAGTVNDVPVEGPTISQCQAPVSIQGLLNADSISPAAAIRQYQPLGPSFDGQVTSPSDMVMTTTTEKRQPNANVRMAEGLVSTSPGEPGEQPSKSELFAVMRENKLAAFRPILTILDNAQYVKNRDDLQRSTVNYAPHLPILSWSDPGKIDHQIEMAAGKEASRSANEPFQAKMTTAIPIEPLEGARRTHVGISDIVHNCQLRPPQSHTKRKSNEISGMREEERRWQCSDISATSAEQVQENRRAQTSSTQGDGHAGREASASPAQNLSVMGSEHGPLAQERVAKQEISEGRPAKRLRRFVEHCAGSIITGMIGGAFAFSALVLTAPSFD